MVTVLACFQEKVKTYEIKLNISLEMHPEFKFKCKPSLIMKVFLSLLNNSIHSIKFKKYKWINITLRELPYDVEFSISDNSLRRDRFLEENPILGFNLEEYQIGHQKNYESIPFLAQYIEIHGGKVLLDKSVDNTKIVFCLPKRNHYYN